MLDNPTSLGFTQMPPIQAQSLLPILQDRDFSPFPQLKQT